MRAGAPSIFIRLQGCSAKHACYAGGVMCDTEFESGKPYTLEQLHQRISQWPTRAIVWTGGEPADQLREAHVAFFKALGYFQCIETSGLKPVPAGLDHITISPKVAEHVILKQFPLRADGTHCDELRWVRHTGQEIPNTKLKAHYYGLSPHFDGFNPNDHNVQHCIKLCLENPEWRLSLQLHKLLAIL